MVLTDSIFISGSTGKSISLMFCKSSVVFIILLDLLEHTVLLSGTSISLVWSSVFNAAVGFTASDWTTGSDWAPIVALGPVLGRGAGFGFLEKVADFSKIGGLFRVFPFHSANFALKVQYKHWTITLIYLLLSADCPVKTDQVMLGWSL